jgi:hypothetical protein
LGKFTIHYGLKYYPELQIRCKCENSMEFITFWNWKSGIQLHISKCKLHFIPKKVKIAISSVLGHVACSHEKYSNDGLEISYHFIGVGTFNPCSQSKTSE